MEGAPATTCDRPTELRRTFNKIVSKRPRGKKSESDRKEARRILGLFLRYERPRLKRLGDDSHDNAPAEWEDYMKELKYPPGRASKCWLAQREHVLHPGLASGARIVGVLAS